MEVGSPLGGLLLAVGGSAAPYLPYRRTEASGRRCLRRASVYLSRDLGAAWGGAALRSCRSCLALRPRLGHTGRAPGPGGGTHGSQSSCRDSVRGEGPRAGERFLPPCFYSRGARVSCSLGSCEGEHSARAPAEADVGLFSPYEVEVWEGRFEVWEGICSPPNKGGQIP